MDLDGQVSLIESRNGERYLTGNEPGLTTRFVRNLCDPVSEALSVTHLRQVMLATFTPFVRQQWKYQTS